jgi:thiol-disulfide isomerase/thioredoxin
VAIAILCRASAVRAEGPFAVQSFDEAKAAAGKSNKPIFIDFYTTWCGPCKMLDEQTWKDPKVVAWLGERTVALKLDAEKEDRLAQRYRVEAYPTLLFMKADGTEIDRMAGFVTPEEFIAEGEGILSGKDPLTRAREKLEQAGPNDPMARMQYADKLAAKGRSAEALQEYLWCFDEGLKHSVAFIGVRLSFLLADIQRLGRSYPPALDALRERQNKARDRVLAGKGGPQAVMDYRSLSEGLGDQEQVLADYGRLKAEHPEWTTVSYLRMQLFNELRRQRRYDELYDEAELKGKVEGAFQILQPNWLLRLLTWKQSKEQREQNRQVVKQHALMQIAACYEVMLGAGHKEEAAALAARTIKADASAETYNVLAWAGYMTGRPEQENLQQAEEAYRLCEGRSAAIVDTYARLLAHFGRRDEAIGILHKALDQSLARDEVEILKKCMADLGERPPMLDRETLVIYGLLAAMVLIVLIAWILKRARGRRVPVSPVET